MKTRDCTQCRHLAWRGPLTSTDYVCIKGHKPRMYYHPDPHIAYEVKRRCADYKEDGK